MPVAAAHLIDNTEHGLPELSDEELIASHFDRRTVLAELCRRHREFCLRVAAGFIGNVEDAEDATQEALLCMCRRLDSFRYLSSFRSWLTSIVINQCLSAIRRRRGAKFVSLGKSERGAAFAEVRSHAKTPEEIHRERELRIALWQRFRRLPAQQRIPLALQAVHGLAVDAIAVQLGLTPGATKTRLRRARLTLQSRLLPWISHDSRVQHPGRQ